MVSIPALWLPIVVGAVLVFVASAVIHVFLGYHDGDFGRVPDEDRVLDVLREVGVDRGEYMIPHAATAEERAAEEYREKMERGPTAILTVLGSGPPNMGKRFGLWFVYCLAVGVFSAYVAGRALGPDAEYMTVFQFVSTTAFLCYAVALWQDPIWYGRKWSTTFKNTVDGLVYALLTAGAFGWLWPS